MSIAQFVSGRRWVETFAELRDQVAGISVSMQDAKERRARFRATCHELYGLSDRELRDIGIARSDIRRIAAQDANRERKHVNS